MTKTHKTSYGIISYSNASKSTNKFLLVQRKHSHSYDALIRGHYNLRDRNYIEKLLIELTPVERSKLLSHSYDFLWNRLWSFSSNNEMFRNEYQQAKLKFLELIKILPALFAKIPSQWHEPEWGFPKGKKYHSEKELEAAQREFLEETGIPADFIKFHTDDEFEPIQEEYTGDDYIHYRHIYFLARTEPSGIGFTDPWNLTQVGEIGKVGWFTIEEIRKILRPYHSQRLELIETIDEMIRRNC